MNRHWSSGFFLFILLLLRVGIVSAQTPDPGAADVPKLPKPVPGADTTPRPSTAQNAYQTRLAEREADLKPGLDLLRANDAAGALSAFQAVLVKRPGDFRVLSLCAEAAERGGQDEEALRYFNESLANHPVASWPMRLSVIQIEAKMGRWADFDRDLAALRAAKKSGEDQALAKSNGFTIDYFEVNGKRVSAVFFPLGAGGYHTLYRFFLPKQVTVATDMSTTANGTNARCQNPNFQPYIDVESDDIDQTSFLRDHADRAAKGERSYSLDSYPAPCSQGLIKFYSAGEPTYETVRADVERAVAGAKTVKP